MKYLLHILRVIVGLVFIVSAIAKLYPIEPFEIIFVDMGITNWLLAPFLARFVIAFEIFLGLSIVFNQWFFNLIYYLAQASLIVFTVYLIYLLITQGNSADCGCFGSWIALTPLASIAKNGVLICILFTVKKGNHSKGLKWILPLLFLTVAFLSTFLLNKVGLQNVQGKEINQSIDLSNLPPLYSTDKKVNFKTGKKVIVFLSVGCDHCKSVSYKLAYLTNKVEPQNLYVIIASLEEENIQPFFNETNLNLPFIWMDDDTFFKYSGGKLPAFIYLEDGVLKRKWTGEFFKVEELEELLESK